MKLRAPAGSKNNGYVSYSYRIISKFAQRFPSTLMWQETTLHSRGSSVKLNPYVAVYCYEGSGFEPWPVFLSPSSVVETL